MALIEPGQRFGRLVARVEIGRYFGDRLWLCDCDCGNQVQTSACHLRRGHSCGCLKREYAARIGKLTDHQFRHGHAVRGTKSAAYTTWQGMIARCSNPNQRAYKNYGGRGIKVCERWMQFKNFLDDMGEPPEGLTIDRINNDGDYEPGNCRWATRKEQCLNSRPRKDRVSR